MASEADTSLQELSLSISRSSPVPLHHQFRQLLQEQIERGTLRPGQQIPHERQYAEYLGISLAPVRQALLDLVRQGYLLRVRGKGTFVRDDKVVEKISLLGSFTESLRGQGLEPAFSVTCAEVVTPPPHVREAFSRRPRRLFRRDRLASAAGG
ncbi:MAG: GntR family transcriptional regulator, partial [Streptosporangiaceae bacterium]